MGTPSSRMLNDPQATQCFQWITVVALTMALVFASLNLVGCASTQRALTAVDKAALVNRAHEADTALPGQAREIAMDAADAFEVIRWHLGGAAPSLDCQERINMRRAARGEEPLEFK